MYSTNEFCLVGIMDEREAIKNLLINTVVVSCWLLGFFVVVLRELEVLALLEPKKSLLGIFLSRVPQCLFFSDGGRDGKAHNQIKHQGLLTTVEATFIFACRSTCNPCRMVGLLTLQPWNH